MSTPMVKAEAVRKRFARNEVLKGITLGRYRGFQPRDMLHEGAIGLAVVAALGYGRVDKRQSCLDP